MAGATRGRAEGAKSGDGGREDEGGGATPISIVTSWKYQFRNQVPLLIFSTVNIHSCLIMLPLIGWRHLSVGSSERLGWMD